MWHHTCILSPVTPSSANVKCACGLQDYLCRRADKHLIPKVDNTNVDRSVATIHATVLACLRHTSKVTAVPSSCCLCFTLQRMVLRHRSALHLEPVCFLHSIGNRLCNTNVDRSVATIYATVLACSRHISTVPPACSPCLPYQTPVQVKPPVKRPIRKDCVRHSSQ